MEDNGRNYINAHISQAIASKSTKTQTVKGSVMPSMAASGSEGREKTPYKERGDMPEMPPDAKGAC